MDWAEGKLAMGDPDRNIVLSEPWDAEHHGIMPQSADEEGKGLCVIADLQRDDGKVSDSAGCDWPPVVGFQGAGFTEWSQGQAVAASKIFVYERVPCGTAVNEGWGFGRGVTKGEGTRDHQVVPTQLGLVHQQCRERKSRDFQIA